MGLFVLFCFLFLLLFLFLGFWRTVSGVFSEIFFVHFILVNIGTDEKALW